MRISRGPVLCNYYLTYRCNAACGFCDIWEKPSPYALPETVEANLLALKRLGVRIIDFTGGEPLLHRNLPAFLKRAKELGFLTTLTTNCLLYPKAGEQLRGLVDMLHFSIDSPDAERHNASRKVDAFRFVEESIRLAKTWGERPDILFTIRDENVQEIGRAWERFCRDEGLTLILNPVFRYGDIGEDLSTDSLRVLDGWSSKPGIYINSAFIELRRKGGNHVDFPVCRAGSTTVVISPENELVLPCYHLAAGRVVVGDDLETTWRSEAVQALIRKEGRMPDCEGCSINCYMEPSFAAETGPLFFRSLPSTLKYSLERWVFS